MWYVLKLSTLHYSFYHNKPTLLFYVLEICLFLGVLEVELGGSQGSHDGIVDTELSCCQCTDHNATGWKTNSAKLNESDFLGDVGKTRHQRTVSSGTGLVDLREKGIGRVGNNGGGNSSNNTRSQRDTKSGGPRNLSRALSDGGVDAVGGGTLDKEFSASVRNLLTQDREETIVEPSNTFGAEHLSESGSETVGEFGIRDLTDTDGLKRTEEDIGDEFGAGGGDNVDLGLVFVGGFISQSLGGLNLEEFNSSEFEPSLDEVSECGGSKTGGQGSGSLFGDDHSHTADQSSVLLLHREHFTREINVIKLIANIKRRNNKAVSDGIRNGSARQKHDRQFPPNRPTKIRWKWTEKFESRCSLVPNGNTYLLGVELDTSLDDIDGGKGSVCDGAADSSSGSSLEEVHSIVLVEVILRGRGQEDGTGRGRGSRHVY